MSKVVTAADIIIPKDIMASYKKTVLITFADDRMTKSQNLCGMSAQRNGVDVVWQNNPETLDKEFVRFNKEIFMHQRGAGYWLWKPYLIYRAMLQPAINDGDILIYADAGIEFVASVNHIIDRMDQDTFLFTNTHPNQHWTKRKVLEAMCPHKVYDKDTVWPQVQASVIFFKVNETTRAFAKEWLLWSQMLGMIDDTTDNEYPYFQEHRHDQSILTCLATNKGYNLHWWPTAYAEHIRVPGDTYPVLFNHHRKRDSGKGHGDSEW